MTIGPNFRRGWDIEKIKKWWNVKSTEYPWHAQSPTSVKPTIVDGDHASCVLKAGWRTWGFKTIEERDKFIMQYGGKVWP